MAGGILINTEDDWDELCSSEMSSNKLVVVICNASFVDRCKALNYKQALRSLMGSTPDARFAFLHAGLMKEKLFELGVKSFPTIILFKNNQKLDEIAFRYSVNIDPRDIRELRTKVQRQS